MILLLYLHAALGYWTQGTTSVPCCELISDLHAILIEKKHRSKSVGLTESYHPSKTTLYVVDFCNKSLCCVPALQKNKTLRILMSVASR